MDIGTFNPVHERSRRYIFPKGEVTISRPTQICVRPSGNHRIENASGKKIIVKGDWLAIAIDTDAWEF